MRAKDWKATADAKILVIGEDSNLQWSDKAPEYVMFADYYFRRFPEDHGERSRNVEARNLFNYITDLTSHRVDPREVYLTNLCNDTLEPSPKGKRILIPEEKALKGIEHIEWILNQYPSIKYVLAMSLQTNYWLQKAGFYTGSEAFLSDAQPRNNGINCIQPYYQPVSGKAFPAICGNVYEANHFPVKVLPVLPAKDYPLTGLNKERYEEAFQSIRTFFSNMPL